MPTGDLVLVALAAGAFVVLGFVVWQGARFLYRFRRRGAVGARLARLGRGLDAELELVVREVDAVRRGDRPPGEIIALLSQAVDDVAGAHRTVKSVAVPVDRQATRDAFEVELLHAARALEAILDACMDLEGSTQADRRERADHTLKWGHLNLLRARESMAKQVHTLDDLGESNDSGWRASRI